MGFTFGLHFPTPLVHLSQDGTVSTDYVMAIAMGDDGTVVLVGYTYGDWSTTNAGSSDCVAMKLNGDGTMSWAWQVKSHVKPCVPGVQKS